MDRNPTTSVQQSLLTVLTTVLSVAAPVLRVSYNIPSLWTVSNGPAVKTTATFRMSNLSFQFGYSEVIPGRWERYLTIIHRHFLSYASQFLICIYCNSRICSNFRRYKLCIHKICRYLKIFYLNNSKINLSIIIL